MIGALWTGISGLSSQQQALDNESNNIANVNTVGFKSSRISFADQMYQDRIGKGSKILDAEKLYVQGNLKLTGVNYDMALSGEGFFTVTNNRNSGTSETLYTRAGNFRMGDNGTLQDAAGNEVQGWMMSAIDSKNDVTSTNPNADLFTNDYNKLLNSKVIRHNTYIETITAKATDYTATAKSDSETIFTGAGMKTKSAKISDIEAAIADYSSWLQKLKDTPDGSSATSISQISQINFKSGTDGLVSKDGDQIYVYIDGNKISQNYVPTTASDEFITSLLDDTTTANLTIADAAGDGSGPFSTTSTVKNNTRYEITAGGKTAYYDSSSSATAADIKAGLIDAITKATISGVTVDVDGSGNVTIDSAATFTAKTTTSMATENYDIAASRVETYKALSNKISEIPGLVSYMAKESDAVGVEANDVLQLTESFSLSTVNKDMYKGIIQIKSLIPGQEFIISELAEVSGSSSIQGNFQTQTSAQAGQGIGALQTSKDALARLITGKQQDVYTATDIGLDGTEKDFTYGVTIYDKELGATIPIPNDGATPPQAVNVLIDNATSIDDIVAAINSAVSPTFTGNNGEKTSIGNNMPSYIVAKNINGNLVIETLDDNYDVEFTGALKSSSGSADDANTATLAGAYTPIDKNNNYSGRQGAGAEFIEIVNKVDQTASKSSLQLRLDTLGISDSAFGEFSVDSTGLITMKQDGADFAIGQVAIALFNNNRGLNPAGDNLLSKTNESGEPIYNLNNDKTAKIEAQTLELSTADLSESLVNLMVFQRAFEANAKSITTSDELLNTLINLKR